jgi:hypothetical protein
VLIKKGNRLVGRLALHAVIVHRQVLHHGVRVVQRVEPLAQPVVARRIAHLEAPVAHLVRHAGDLHHPRRHLPQMHLVRRHRLAVEVEVVHQQLCSRSRRAPAVLPASVHANVSASRSTSPSTAASGTADHTGRARQLSTSPTSCPAAYSTPSAHSQRNHDIKHLLNIQFLRRQ